MTKAIGIVVPAYNEQASVGDCIAAIREALAGRDDYEIVLVNDGSHDAPREKYEGLADRTIHHRERRGYGAALQTGFRGTAGETVVIIDADGTYPAAAIPRLLDALNAGADMAVAQRTLIPGGGFTLNPTQLLRAGAKLVLRRIANYLAGKRIPDLNSGLRAFRRADLERYRHLLPQGFSLTTTLTLAFLCNGLLIDYIPIEYGARAKGQPSKIRPVRDTGQIFLTIIRSVLFFNPLKVCLPLALACWAAAALTLVLSGLYADQIMDGTVTVCALSGVQVLMIGLLAEVIVHRK